MTICHCETTVIPLGDDVVCTGEFHHGVEVCEVCPS